MSGYKDTDHATMEARIRADERKRIGEWLEKPCAKHGNSQSMTILHRNCSRCRESLKEGMEPDELDELRTILRQVNEG